MSRDQRSLALIRGLRRAGDETQLTQTLNAIFQADEHFAADFVRVVFHALDGQRAAVVPQELASVAEEVVADGRLDLRLRADDWDVILELKLYASYGREQLPRYLDALSDVQHAYIAAITRDVPRFGEPSRAADPRWLGSVRWRHLLSDLRALPLADEALALQWPLFLDVLDLEGSMGFTRPDPALFDAWSKIRLASKHTADFVEAVRMPLLEALIDVLGGGDRAAAFYRGRGGRPVLSRSLGGITDIPFRVPADGPIRVRGGLFSWNPPGRFYVAPHNGRRWVTRASKASSDARRAVQRLREKGFREYDLHAFLPLTEERLLAPSLEDDVVEWARDRFADIAESGLLELDLRAISGVDDVAAEATLAAEDPLDAGEGGGLDRGEP